MSLARYSEDESVSRRRAAVLAVRSLNSALGFNPSSELQLPDSL